MEENEDEPEDVRNSTAVEIEIRAGEKDETAGNSKSGAKKPKHDSPSRDVKNRRKNKVQNQLVKTEAICYRGRNSRPLEPPKSMSVFIYSPLCTLPRLEVIPRHCLSKKQYIDILATPSRKCPSPCCGKTVVRRIRPVSARMDELAQPARRHLMATLQDRGESLPAELIDNLVKTIEEKSCLTPEQAEDYFRDKNPKRCRKSARRSRKSKRQSRKQESCALQLDKESVTNQYLMAERFVKSILQWRCSIPTEDFRDIANVILRRLSLTLGYDPMANRDLRSQQMRFLADMIACWISGVLLEVSEDHKKEIQAEWRQRQLDAEREREEEEITVTIDLGDSPRRGKDNDSNGSGMSMGAESSEDEEPMDGRKSADEEERRERLKKWHKKGGLWEKTMSRKEQKSGESIGFTMEEAGGSAKDEAGERSSREPEERPLGREERRKERALEKERARKSEERRKREEEEAEKERKREKRRKEKEERKVKAAEARRQRREAEKKRQEDEKKRLQEEEERRKKEEEEEKKRKEEEERKLKEEEEERKKKEEEEKKKLEEAEKKKQEEEEKKKLEEEAKKKQEEEEMKKQEEEKKKREEEEKKREEEEKKRKEEEEEKKRKEVEEKKRKAEEEKKLKEAEKKKRKEEEEKRKRERKRRKEAGEQKTSGERSATYGPVFDTIYNVLDELPTDAQTDPVQSRIQRAIYENVVGRVESENPASVNADFKDVVDVVASKAAVWLKKVLVDAGLRFDERSLPAVRSVEVREWAKWVDDVTVKAHDWADWIHKLVGDAEEKSTMQINRGEWYDWTSDAETDALLWRRYYLETTHQARRNEMAMAGRPVEKSGNEYQPGNLSELEITDTGL